MTPISVNLVFGLLAGIGLWAIPRAGARALVGVALVQVVAALVVSWLGLRHWDWQVFGGMQVFCWWLFIHLPLLLIALGALWRQQPRRAALAAGAFSLLVLVGVDAFFIEPRWLEQTHHTISHPEVEERIRVVLLADIQTDDPGAWEARVLAAAQAAQPDLVLFAGDYLQTPAGAPTDRARAVFRQQLADSGLQPRLGMVAVQGDVDPPSWPGLFEGSGVTALTTSQTLELGPLSLTALSISDSRSSAPPIPERSGVHLVLGHSPDFALAAPPADLLLAGHVHGGQLQLPGLGPVLTLSRVPRSWAAGRTTLPSGAILIVSRGIGMERAHAPRFRFLCRPELVIIDLMPISSG